MPSPQLQVIKAELFQALAHPIRIRLLELLVSQGETSVRDLQHALRVGQPIVSQQLARLRARGIVVVTKRGSTTYYGVADPLFRDLLWIAKQILNRRLAGVRSLLDELGNEPTERVRSTVRMRR